MHCSRARTTYLALEQCTRAALTVHSRSLPYIGALVVQLSRTALELAYSSGLLAYSAPPVHLLYIGSIRTRQQRRDQFPKVRLLLYGRITRNLTIHVNIRAGQHYLYETASRSLSTKKTETCDRFALSVRVCHWVRTTHEFFGRVRRYDGTNPKNS